MTPRPEVALVFNLLQDVNILRALAYLVRQETDARVHLLITRGFLKRDSRKIWQKELSSIARETDADIHVIATDADTQAALQGRGGVLITASESDLSAHRETAQVLCSAPAAFVRITLQHGLECVGFRQSREHIISHGRDVGFNADITCTWFEPAQLTATRVSERGKIVVTGPSTLLQRPRIHPKHPPRGGGIICENMHSVRLSATGDHKALFMDIFFAFCARQKAQNTQVTLRPHPGGQYVLKNNIALADNIMLNNLPIYDVNMSGYQYGISAPSTVVLDMVLAGIPVGVWSDPGGVMDLSNYKGLMEISTLEDWITFERDSRLNPAQILTRQHQFLNGLQMPTDPAEIYRRYTRLLRNLLTRVRPVGAAVPHTVPVPAMPAPKRVLFIANRLITTLQLSFLKPLKGDFDRGDIIHDILTEVDLKKKFGEEFQSAAGGEWMQARIKVFRPDLILCSRYSGPHATYILQTAKALKVPVVYHIDDDLLHIPRELGYAKWRSHNAPFRLETVRTMLDHSDLVYASTLALQNRLRYLNAKAPVVHGNIYSSSKILRTATVEPIRRVGYMGTTGHMHDLDLVLPAIAEYLDANPAVDFELFGLSPVPEALERFGARVHIVPPVLDYAEFLGVLAQREWDIGLCPLSHIQFNTVKANTKWVEYTACGMATVATKGMVYDGCAGEGRGLLVTRSEWADALQTLTDDPGLRYRMALQAQTHLLLTYSETRLREQVLDIFAQARALHDQAIQRMSTQETGGSASAGSGRITPSIPDSAGLISLTE